MNEQVKNEPKNEIVVYQPNGSVRIDVQLANETVWLSILQMCQLFERERSVIAKHLKNAIEEGELELGINVQNLHINQKGRPQALYDLDAVISVGYRVKSLRGTQFRRWATKVLRDRLLRGYSVNSRLNQLEDRMDRRLSKHDADIIELRKDVDFFISSSLPPKEKVFVEGKMLDAQVELTRIVKAAKRRIVLIDNYIDERTLMLLGSRRAKVSCTVYTLRPNSPKLAPALANYAKEYPSLPITVKGYKKSHDRFLIVDNTVWHIGASLKDAGSALFAMMKMELDPAVILGLLP